MRLDRKIKYIFVDLCECGCGKYAKSGNRFIAGHNRRGEKQSEKEKRKRAVSLSKSWATDYERKRRQSERMTGEKNPFYGKFHTQDAKNKNRSSQLKRNEDIEVRLKNTERQLKYWENHPEKKKEISNKMKKLWQEKEFQEKWIEGMKSVHGNIEVRNKIGEASKRLWKTEDYIRKHSGENNPNWKGGISGEPLYNRDWDKELKEKIRQRDNYQCQECFIVQSKLKRKLHIHHIDYDKENCDPNNLISLCHSCHVKTNNKNREKWTEHFKLKIFEKINNILISYLPEQQFLKAV
jgi:hypothetical protein